MRNNSVIVWIVISILFSAVVLYMYLSIYLCLPRVKLSNQSEFEDVRCLMFHKSDVGFPHFEIQSIFVIYLFNVLSKLWPYFETKFMLFYLLKLIYLL